MFHAETRGIYLFFAQRARGTQKSSACGEAARNQGRCDSRNTRMDDMRLRRARHLCALCVSARKQSSKNLRASAPLRLCERKSGRRHVFRAATQTLRVSTSPRETGFAHSLPSAGRFARSKEARVDSAGRASPATNRGPSPHPVSPARRIRDESKESRGGLRSGRLCRAGAWAIRAAGINDRKCIFPFCKPASFFPPPFC